MYLWGSALNFYLEPCKIGLLKKVQPLEPLTIQSTREKLFFPPKGTWNAALLEKKVPTVKAPLQTPVTKREKKNNFPYSTLKGSSVWPFHGKLEG